MKKKSLLSISEAAKILNVSIMTLRRWDEDGRLVPLRKSQKGHRYYRKEDVQILLSDSFKAAQDWAISGKKISEDFYCQNSAIFQSRLVKMGNLMMQNQVTKVIFPLIVSIAGEIGNNSYDHNLGQWPDTPGIFFSYDLDKNQIVLADRGLGILETLKRAKPDLKNHEQALKAAFTETISGRAPENRGNGLKYVRRVISQNPINLFFQTGDAKLWLSGENSDLKIIKSKDNLRGCLALIYF